LLAKKTQSTLAGWIRDIALNRPDRKPVRRVDPELLYELNKIGVNMNQLAKVTNSKLLTNEEKIKLLVILSSIDNELKGILNHAS